MKKWRKHNMTIVEVEQRPEQLSDDALAKLAKHYRGWLKANNPEQPEYKNIRQKAIDYKPI